MDTKIDANLKEMKAGHEHLKEEMMAKMETNQERNGCQDRRQSRKDGSHDRRQQCEVRVPLRRIMIHRWT
jgi:hypothetical protein